ncbi:amino acid ABC transporter ATP-binding protein [Hutsoniella sourekii]|uniref:amino acid ABC transporter ATP-binding protein n=1 Tax=Hutsoniella sourekii TaxID=87650 RepID=UPI000488DABA|nr:ATP-binding cassette domain-containing protein [Hutsoniella sourekii]
MGLKVTNISKKFGNQTVIDNYSFSMAPGEVVIVLGESGSGKTTLLRMINHLETVDSGSISINDTYLVEDGNYRSRHEIQDYQFKIGLVFQDYQLFPNLSVEENLLLAPLANQFAPANELKAKAKALLEEMGVYGKGQAMPDQLSGGQKQRVAIARALMLEPDLICFDEPTSALDEKTVSKVAEIIQQLAKNGKMVLIITHDRALVDSMGSQARVIESSSFI